MAADRPPKRCVIAGGGRWARVVLRELLGILPAETAVTVVSPSAVEVMRGYLAQDETFRAHARRIELRRNMPQGPAGDGDIAVVVNKPAQHHEAAKALLQSGYHVLVEKPFTTDPAQASDLVALADQRDRVVAAGLVFLAAEFVHEFLRRLPFAPSLADAVELEWGDPPVEIRHGEVKRMPADVSPALEILPHAWSLLKAVYGRETPVAFAAAATTAKNATDVAGDAGGVAVRIRIDGAAVRRKRLLTLKSARGDAALDFAGDPAVATIAGMSQLHLPVAGREGRPMARMLNGFIGYVRRRDAAAAWQRGIVTGPMIAAQMEQICAVDRALGAGG